MEITRRNRTVARCVIFAPETCEEMECDQGMVCVMRKRVRDGKEVPRCVPENPSHGGATDCSQLQCREGLVCEMLGDQARCVMIPPPTDCAEIECEEGMECQPVGNGGQVRCISVYHPLTPPFPPQVTNLESTARPTPQPFQIERGCGELDCDAGFRCHMSANRERNGDQKFHPTCVPMQCPARMESRPHPPRTCEELRCGRQEECVVCDEGEETRARCQRLAPLTGTEEKTVEEKPTDEKPADDIKRRGRLPRSCEELECAVEELCFEFELARRNATLARCVSGGEH